MTEKELKTKTKNIGVSVSRLCQELPVSSINNTYINQIPGSSASMRADKIPVAPIKTLLKKLDPPETRNGQSKIKNIKSKNNEQ
jgi:hypothetical protein